MLPVAVMAILCAGLAKKVKIFETFTEGASEGITTVIRILPTLVGIMTAIGVFRASGALEAVVSLLAPVASLFGIPAETMPLVLMRPVSGVLPWRSPPKSSTCTARIHTSEEWQTMLGSTETIFYTLAVYYGSVGVRNIRYTLVAALIADGVSAVSSAWCVLIFGR